MTCPKQHTPVMPEEVMALLNLPAGGTAIDATLGMGGHAVLMATRLEAQGHLIGIDRDRSSLAEAKKHLSAAPARVDFRQGNFSDLGRIVGELKVLEVDGILMDLGLSSFQLNNAQRGFSFQEDGPLDMRLDPDHNTSVADLVKKLPEAELARIIADFGEERFARQIAKAIVQMRAEAKIERTTQLAGIVLRALPHGYTRGRIHPATRTFQALRIAVNDELASLSEGLEKGRALLKPGGRMCVIAFHSLEDRIVKGKFRRWAEEEWGTILTKKPLQPTEEECVSNPRSRSAKLRAIQRTP